MDEKEKGRRRRRRSDVKAVDRFEKQQECRKIKWRNMKEREEALDEQAEGA